jgi:uncharacterized protein YndB with AHSA1/START domain
MSSANSGEILEKKLFCRSLKVEKALFKNFKMESNLNSPITIETSINAPMETVWQCWTQPKHICKWYFASDDWHAPVAENDLRLGGKFLIRMEAKDNSFGFDFEGIYTQVEQHKNIEYVLADHRKVMTKFIAKGNQTQIVETFDAENENSLEMQKTGWQAILDNFKKHCEAV